MVSIHCLFTRKPNQPTMVVYFQLKYFLFPYFHWFSRYTFVVKKKLQCVLLQCFMVWFHIKNWSKIILIRYLLWSMKNWRNDIANRPQWIPLLCCIVILYWQGAHHIFCFTRLRLTISELWQPPLKLTVHNVYFPLIEFKCTDSPAGIYLFKVNDRNTRTRREICSKLTIKTPERRQWRRSGIFIVNFEHISHLVLMFLLLTLNMLAGSYPMKTFTI